MIAKLIYSVGTEIIIRAIKNKLKTLLNRERNSITNIFVWDWKPHKHNDPPLSQIQTWIEERGTTTTSCEQWRVSHVHRWVVKSKYSEDEKM